MTDKNIIRCESMTVFCEKCEHITNCELAKHEEVDTCKKGKKYSDLIVFDDQPKRRLRSPEIHNE